LERLMRVTATARNRETLGAFIDILERQRMASLKTFADTMTALCRGEPSPFVEPRQEPGESKTEAYVRRLRETAEEPRLFFRLLELLRGDPDMKRADVVAVASRFATPLAKGASKKLALARISERRAPRSPAASYGEMDGAWVA
ncbi:MAG: hypothetical protein MI723_06995, partial [Caulobacterales bacterium]|nr:hypothetical protein [Caulobacterales bacterium]